MGAFALTIGVLSALISGGYALNMYLYAHGVGKSSSPDLQAVGAESGTLRPVRAAYLEARDAGLRYARVGILVFAFCPVVLVVGLIAAIFAVL